MAKYSSSGWHFQSTRHSNAKRYGHAGGKYSNKLSISVAHSEPKPSLKYKQIPIYNYDEASKELKQKILDNYRDINVDHDWWNMDGLFDPTAEDFKRKGVEFRDEYNKATKNGYSTLNNFKIESFDLERGNYLQIKSIDTKNKETFLKQIGLTKKEAKKVEFVSVENHRENDSKLVLDLGDKISEAEYDKIYEKAQEGFSELIDRAKKSLRENYEYYTSDESIAETLRANEYTFDEKGKIA
jgi:hypothetical protein